MGVGVVYFVFLPSVVTPLLAGKAVAHLHQVRYFLAVAELCALRNVARRHAIEWVGNLHYQKAFTKIPLPSKFKSTC